MNSRWAILALLFCARIVMAFQFQAIPALTAEIQAAYLVGLDAIGVAIGLYMAPGILVSVPGALLAQRIDAKSIVTLGLILMAVGAAIMATAGSWRMLLVGQALAGIGGVLLNVLMTRMVADWFAGRELATALGLFINSYPTGIALAFICLPLIGLQAGMWLISGAAAAAALAFGLLYRSPPELPPVSARINWGTRRDRAVAVYAGGVWGLFNAGVIVVVGLGPAYLIGEGLTPAAAGRLTSLIMVGTACCGPVGGILADRFGHRDVLITGGLLISGALMLSIMVLPPSAVIFAAVGMFGGLSAGPIMSLPAAALPVAARTTGMGLFFTLYYFSIVSAPPIGGLMSEVLGTAKAALFFGAALQVLALLSLFAFRRSAVRE